MPPPCACPPALAQTRMAIFDTSADKPKLPNFPMARLEPLDEVDAIVGIVEEHDAREDEVEATDLIALTITHVFYPNCKGITMTILRR